MFVSVVIPLCATQDASPRFFGREAYAVWLYLVQGVAPHVADQLHGAHSFKPFTVSSLLEPGQWRDSAYREQDPMVTVRAGNVYEWRITAFSRELAELIVKTLLPSLPRALRFGPVTFETGVPCTDAAKHPWAATSEVQPFAARWLDRKRTVPKQFTLEFVSPTAYRQLRRNALFPDAPGIFARYAAIWNLYAAPSLAETLLQTVREEVNASHYRLATHAFPHGTHPESGWTGNCTYTFFGERATREIMLLASFAFFCGTGYKTTQGMGQTRLVATRTYA